jgi:hypothetical protein
MFPNGAPTQQTLPFSPAETAAVLAAELGDLHEFLLAAAEDLSVEDAREVGVALRRIREALVNINARLAAAGPG